VGEARPARRIPDLSVLFRGSGAKNSGPSGCKNPGRAGMLFPGPAGLGEWLFRLHATGRASRRQNAPATLLLGLAG
jgi:hypothetical protein